MKKRLLSAIVIVSLLICALPISALAAQQDETSSSFMKTIGKESFERLN